MAVTRSQANTILGKVVRRIAKDFCDEQPDVLNLVIRVMINEAKQIGTPKANNTMKAVARELYMDCHNNIDPVGVHGFRHWILDTLTDTTRIGANAYDDGLDVSTDDAFDAEPGDIN